MKPFISIAFCLCLLLFSSCHEDEIKNIGFYPLDISSEEGLLDISFIDDNNGVVCGSFGFFAKTNNGGRTWEQLDVGFGGGLLSAFMLDVQTYFVGGPSLFTTTNSGQSFYELGNFSSNSIFDIHFFNELQGEIIFGGKIYKTEDGGQVWTIAYEEANFSDILIFTSDKIGYLAGGATWDGNSSGEIHKTTDGGNNWTQILSSSSEVRAISFLNDTTGFYVNWDWELYKTEDGGNSWVKISVMPEPYTLGLLFVSESEGYAITSQGKLSKTEDGGLTWIIVYEVDRQDPLAATALTAMIKTPNHIYVVGNNGTILKKDL